MVTVYSKDNCNNCYILKNDLHRMGVKFEEINLNKTPQYIDDLKEKGFRSLPVIKYGDQWDSGYNKGIVDKITTFAMGL